MISSSLPSGKPTESPSSFQFPTITPSLDGSTSPTYILDSPSFSPTSVVPVPAVTPVSPAPIIMPVDLPGATPVPSMNNYQTQTFSPSIIQVPFTLINGDDSIPSTIDYTLTLTGVNTTEAVALTPALTNTTLVFYQDLFADEEEVTVTNVEITVENVKYLSRSRNASSHNRFLADEDKADVNVKLYLETSNALTSAEIYSIVEVTISKSTDDFITEIQRSVSSDITGGEMFFVSNSTSTIPSTMPTSLATAVPNEGPTDVPSVSKTLDPVAMPVSIRTVSSGNCTAGTWMNLMGAILFLGFI